MQMFLTGWRNIKGAQIQRGWVLFFASASAGTIRLVGSVIQVIKANEKTVVQLARCLQLL